MKKVLIIFTLLLIITPLISKGQEVEDEIFKARVLEILEEKSINDDSGEIIVLQKLKLKGLEGTWENQEVIFDGTKYEVITSNKYEVGDKVMAVATTDGEGNIIIFVTDYVRQGSLYWLAGIFSLVVILVGRLKGLRSLIVLVLTFFVILKFILPLILSGNNPLFISIAGSLIILLIAIYLTEGFKRNSTIAITSITISLIITGFISVWFTKITRLTGFANEDAFFLKNQLGSEINIQGLLLAGIIIGALGVLDDVVVSQIETIQQIKTANPGLSKKELFQKAMKVGITHMSAMVNTLFLAYVGASLPILLLFSMNSQTQISFNHALNNEIIATEIVRTLTGSIGLVLAIPVATLLGVYYIRLNKKLHTTDTHST